MHELHAPRAYMYGTVIMKKWINPEIWDRYGRHGKRCHLIRQWANGSY